MVGSRLPVAVHSLETGDLVTDPSAPSRYAASVACSAWLGARHGYGTGHAFGHSSCLVAANWRMALHGHAIGYWLALAWLLAGALCGLGMVLAWPTGMALGPSRSFKTPIGAIAPAASVACWGQASRFAEPR